MEGVVAAWPNGKVSALLAVLIIAVAGCGGSAITAAPSPIVPTPTIVRASPAPVASAPLPSPTPSAAAALGPICAHDPPPTQIADAHHAKDGVTDAAGRIVFGRLTGVDPGLGQLVSLNGIDPDGSDLAQILDCETERPRFSRDGRQLAFSIAMTDGSWQIATSAPDGSDLHVIPTSSPGWADTLDWSADDSWFVYSFAPDPCVPDRVPCVLRDDWTEHLWRMNVDGSDQRLLGNPETFDWEPRISPDGREVVFDRWSDGEGDSKVVMIRDLVTGAERTVTSASSKPEHPEWSPDGRWIIYNTQLAADGDPMERIERVPVNDSTARPTVLFGDKTHHGYKPTYSPDGSKIAFGCDRRLCTMNANGSKVVVLYEEPGTEINHFAWSVVRPEG